MTVAGILVAAMYAAFGSYIGRVLNDAKADPRWRVLGVVVLFGVVFFVVKMLRYLGRDESSPRARKRARPGRAALVLVLVLAALLYALFEDEILAFLARPESRRWVPIAGGAAALLLGLAVVRAIRRRRRAG